MQAWGALFPDLLPQIPPGRAEPLLERQLLRVTQELCQDTRLWRVMLDPVLTAAGEVQYEIEFPGANELVRLEGATLDGSEVPLWRHGDGVGLFIKTLDTKTVELSRAPSAGQSLVLDVSIKPSLRATGVDDWIFDQHGETIVMGAVARLTGSGDLYALYRSKVDAIATRVWKGHAATRPRTKGSWF